MAETIKFTEEEQTSIKELRQQVTTLFTQLGQVRVERERRLTEIDNLESQLLTQHKELTEKEQELFKSLNEKYGDGNYNPETGEFTPIEQKNETPSE